MCSQCVTGVSIAAVASATGARAWLSVHQPCWFTPKLMKLSTACLLTVGVLAAGLQV
ncbi:MAG: hypothetical protein ACSLFD_11175 [Solirubrobacterales bacterium]